MVPLEFSAACSSPLEASDHSPNLVLERYRPSDLSLHKHEFKSNVDKAEVIKTRAEVLKPNHEKTVKGEAPMNHRSMVVQKTEHSCWTTIQQQMLGTGQSNTHVDF